MRACLIYVGRGFIGPVRHSTTLSYPPIENSFNSCQGHPLVCLPPGTAERQGNPEEKRLNAQQFIMLTLVDSCRCHKMRKAVEAWKQKRSAYYDIYNDTIHTLRHLFLTWTSLCLPHFKNLYQSYAAIRLLLLDFRLAIAVWTVARHTSILVKDK